MRAGRAVALPASHGAVPPAWVEYAFYCTTAYGVLAAALGVLVSGLAGALLALLAIACVHRTGSRALRFYRPIAAPLGAAAFMAIIQLAVHHESSQDVRPFVVWAMTLIIVHSLSFRRGFLTRFVGMALLLGIAVLPYLQFMSGGIGVQRAALDSSMGLGFLSNSNDLAAWFGFCAIWLTTAGIESKRHGNRVVYWAIGVMCLYVVSLTVSRGTVLAFAIAATAASRRLLSRGFVPALCLVIVAGIIYETGVFESTLGMYEARGMEETGRGIVWPSAFERFLGSPIVGVGVSQVGTYEASVGHEITPHNSFLFIGLASGLAPLVLFIAYWLRAAKGATRTRANPHSDAAFRLPLLLYALVQSMIGNVSFMSPYVIVVLSVSMTGLPLIVDRSRRVQAIRFQSRSQSANQQASVPVLRGTFRRRLQLERFL